MQESPSWQQLLNDIQKLQKLDHQIQLALSVYNQMQMNARFFSNKSAWQGLHKSNRTELVTQFLRRNRYVEPYGHVR